MFLLFYSYISPAKKYSAGENFSTAKAGLPKLAFSSCLFVNKLLLMLFTGLGSAIDYFVDYGIIIITEAI